MRKLDMTTFPFPQSDPTDLYRLRDGLYAVDLLGAALVEFDFFTWLEANPSSLAGLCSGLGIQERPADVLLTLCASMDLVQQQNGVFRITDKAREFLVEGSPFNMKAYYAALKDRPVCQDYMKILRTGKPANWGSFKDEKDWARAMEDDAFAQTFTAAMDCRGLVLAPSLAEKVNIAACRRLLDVAGGSGVYASAMVARHPHLEAAVFEKPPVDQVAVRALARRDMAERIAVTSGDMFRDDWPEGYDAHLLSNVLHDWDVAEVKQLLSSSFHALPPGGVLILHDAHINESKTGPLPVAMYSALLMHTTEGKCYSLSEMQTWLAEIGFDDFEFAETTMDRSFIMARKPPN